MAGGLVTAVGGGAYGLSKALTIENADVTLDAATKALKEAQKGLPPKITVLVKTRLGFFAGTNVSCPEEQALRAYPAHTKVISCKPYHGGIYEVVLERP